MCAYRSSGDLPFRGGRGGGEGERWDRERFAIERDRARFTGGGERERFEERDTRFTARGPYGGSQVRERSVDDVYERRGPRGVEEDRFERRTYYDDEPRYEPERRAGRERGQSITIEKERERERFYSPSPPPRGGRGGPARPAFLRRQSSLDTFDRKPLTRFIPPAREEYGPPARYLPEVRPPPLTPIPLPRSRGLPPPRRFAERDYYDEIDVAEPDFYGDDNYRGAPERIREREIIRRRRRSRSKESRRSESRRSHSVRESVRGSVKGSVRSESISSSSSSETEVSVRSEFPKKGKTRMPARLVSKKAIADLGYPFEEEGETIIILKALGRENIDEVIKLSEDYKVSETDHVHETTLTTFLVGPEGAMSGARSEAGTVIEERHEVFTVPQPPPVSFAPPPPPQIVETDTRVVEHFHPAHHDHPPIIVDAAPREETTFIERRKSFVERSNPIPVGPLALALPDNHRVKDERAIRAEIKALEAEKEALRAEKRANREMRKADRIRRGGRSSETDLVLYESERYETGGDEFTVIKRERVEEEGGVRIEKDKKAPPPRLVRAMLATLT